jgi:putative aldouronate transport system substrate-binding protein
MSANNCSYYLKPFAAAALLLGGLVAAQDEDWRNSPPYAPYDETVTVRLVKGGQEGASLLPEGETIEDNRALKYIEDTLNIDIVYNWLAPSDSYNDKLNLTIASGDIPDMMVVNPLQLQQLTVAGAIEDMTPYIDTYANSDLKSAYAETEGTAFEAATIDGKIMGVPNVSPQADAPGMAWVRKDWLDKLGLEAPKTVDDIEAIARAFIEQDPDGDGAANTVGLTGTLQPIAIASNLHGFDAIFNAYGAFPTRFYENEEGQVVYGSVQPETKEALARLAQMYQDGLIDPEFATKNAEKSNELVVGGRSGIMFGPWWIPWYPLSDSVSSDPEANWQPYLIENENGEYTYSMNDYTSSFIVVKKGFSHPEIALKIINIENDLSYGFNDAPQYYPNFNEIWTTLFPIPFLVEQPYVVESLGQRYNQALSGEIDPATFTEALKAEFNQVQTDVDAPRSDPSSWATRMARLDAALLLDAADYGEVRSVPAVARELPKDIAWPSLEKMEEETFLQIITGAMPVDAFDTFAEQWYASGGTALLEKLNQP